jgi:hypothetical protein
VDGKQITKLIASIADVMRKAFLIDAKPNVSAKQKTEQDNCPHRQGCLGPMPGQLTNIIWHTFEDDPVHPKGICLACQRLWVYTDPDYAAYRAMKSAHKPSTGGLPVKSSAYPYMAGTVTDVGQELSHAFLDNTTYTDDAAFMYGDKKRPKHPVDEPPIEKPLNEYLLDEIVKRYPEKALKLLRPLTGAAQ